MVGKKTLKQNLTISKKTQNKTEEGIQFLRAVSEAGNLLPPRATT